MGLKFIQLPFNSVVACLFLLLFPYASLGFQDANEPSDWKLELNRAKIATFYSAAYGNGYHELKLAQQYATSAREKLLKAMEKDTSLVQYLQVVDGIWEELSGSEAIAVDNLNYRYPTSSLLAGHRNDFEVRDAAEELLVEDLLEKILDQNDPLTRGRIAESIDFVVLQVAPYDQNLVLVGSDYFSANSGHYVIRLHELTEILGPAGFNRYKENKLIDEDWKHIFKAYNIDKVLNIQVSDRGSIIPGLFYKGATLYTVKHDEKPVYVAYFENFKVDKIDSWDRAVIIMCLNSLLLLLGLFLIFTVKVQKGLKNGRFLGYNILFEINPGFIWEMCVIACTSLVAIAAFHVLGEQFAPAINSFYKESLVYFWVGYQVFLPFIGAVILSYLVLSKMPGVIANNEVTYIAILFGAFMAQVVMLSYYEYHIALLPNPIFYYFKWIPFLGLFFSGVVSGKLLNRIFKKEPVSQIGKFFLLLLLILPCLAFWLEFGGRYDASNWSYTLSGVLGIVILLNPKWLRITNSNKPTSQNLANHKGLEEPNTWYTSGTNANVLSEQLIQFIESDSFDDRTFILTGTSGAGKTRLLSEVIKKIRLEKLNVRWFQGTCNQSEETESANFETFEEAFSIDGERIDLEASDRTLPPGFFTDRTQLASALGKAVEQIASSTMVDVSGMLHAEDTQSKSVDEIARELLYFLSEKYVKGSRSKVILVLDDFQWADSNTQALLEKFRNLVNEQPKYAPYFKFILVISTSEFTPEMGDKLITSNQVKASTLKLEDGVAFVNSIIQDECFQMPGYETCFRFDALLKGHVLKILNSNQVAFTPGDFLGYLATLEQEEFITLDNDVIRLIKEPREDEIQLLHVRRATFEKAFNQLEDSDKALLESAAIVGYKFDAEILSKIWKLDLIKVLERLEKLEGEFVKDQSHEDNIYAFSDKTLYQVIRNSAGRSKDKNDARQLIVEYQKRIISTVLEDNDNRYLEGLDLDILLSASERCFYYNHVSYIKENTPIIVLTACKKLASKGLEGQCLKFLKNLYEQGLTLNKLELNLLLDVLQALTHSDRSLTRFTFTKQKNENESEEKMNKRSFLEDVYRWSEMYSNPATGDLDETELDRIAVILMGGVMSFIRPLIRRGKISNISDLQNLGYSLNILDLEDIHFAQLIIKWFERISILIKEGKIVNEAALQRIQFYSLISQNESQEVFHELFEKTLNVGNSDLAGEIARDLCLNGLLENKNKYLSAALILISGGALDFTAFENPTLDKKDVRVTISKFLSRNDLTPKITSDFNFLLSRLREYYYFIEKEYDFVLELTELALEISISMNDTMGQKLALSFKGAANFQLKQFENSLNAYWEYFEFMLRTTRIADEFVYPLEGIIRASLQLNSFDVYFKANQDLYESLIILGKPAIDEPLRFSPIDNSQSLKELIDRMPKLPKMDYSNEVTEQAQLILRLIVSVALADGKIEPNETYNLKEATRALSDALNINFKAMLSEMENGQKQIIALVNNNELPTAFRNDCERLKTVKSALSPEAILELCRLIAGADKNWDESEIVLVNIAKEVFDLQ